ncbi:unnamed protein product [Sphagnum compactum]
MAPKRKATTPAAKAEDGEVAVPKKRGRPPRAKTSDPVPVAAPSSLAPVAAPGPPQAAASQKKKPAKKKAAPKAGKKAASSKKKAAPVKQISTEDEEEDKENGEVPPATVDEADSGNHTKAAQIKSVTIEHCKSDALFKKSAQKLEEALKAAGVNLEVITNPEKPRKGSFEVQDDKGNKYVSLQNLSKPYTKLKSVDLEAVAAAIASKTGVIQVS